MQRLVLKTPVTYMDSLGKGSHGVVYRAVHPQWPDPIAVKQIERRDMAMKEIEIIEKIAEKCPNMVQYYGYWEDNEGISIGMEYVAGYRISEAITLAKQNIYMTEEEIRKISYDLLRTLEYMHFQNILYGDIKPANILYAPPGGVRVIDFSCSRFYIGEAFLHPVGSPLFFAPEKIQRNYGLESDIWALGILLYMLCCGMHPFIQRPETIEELEYAMTERILGFEHPRWDAISKEAKDLIAKMLTVEVEKRIHAEEALQDAWFRGMKKR